MKRFEPFQNVYSLLIRLLINAQCTKDIETKIQFPAKDHVSTSFSNESHFFPGGFDSSAMSQQQTMATQNVLHNLPPALAGIIMIKHAPACFPHASILCQICHSGNPIPPDYVLQLLTYSQSQIALPGSISLVYGRQMSPFVDKKCCGRKSRLF